MLLPVLIKEFTSHVAITDQGNAISRSSSPARSGRPGSWCSPGAGFGSKDIRAVIAGIGPSRRSPPMAEQKEKRRRLAAEKKALYAEYHAAQRDMREALAVKTNIDHLLEITAPAGIRNRRDSAGIARPKNWSNV